MAYLQAQIPTHIPTYPMSGNSTPMPPLPRFPSFMPSHYMQPQLSSSPVLVQTINQPSETPMPPFPSFIAPSNLPQTQFVPLTQPTQGQTTPHHPFIPPTYVAPTMPPPNHTAMYGPPPVSPVSPPVYIVIPSMEPGSGRRGPHRRRRQSFCLVCRKRTHETKNCRKLRSAAASTRGFWQ